MKTNIKLTPENAKAVHDWRKITGLLLSADEIVNALLRDELELDRWDRWERAEKVVLKLNDAKWDTLYPGPKKANGVSPTQG